MGRFHSPPPIGLEIGRPASKFVSLLSSLFTAKIAGPPRFTFPAAAILAAVIYSPAAAGAQLVVNELYYDHPGKDDGYEFVELMNASSYPVALADVCLEFHNGSGEGWQTLWCGAAADSVGPGGLFVVGDADVRPAVDALIALRLQNGPDAVRLTRGGEPEDLVAYGGLEDEAYVEEASAPGVPSGFSLGRLPDGRDTDNNLRDFYLMVPSPGKFNEPHHDVAIANAPQTKARGVLDEAGVETIHLRLVNDGLFVVPAAAVTVEVWDSTAATTSLLMALDNAESIQPGRESNVSAHVSLRPGYHWLIARATYEPDERAHNDTATLLRRVGGPAILISEVLSYPKDGCPQFVELYNAGGRTESIRGFRLRDKAHPPAQITPDSVFILPFDYLVVTPDEASLRGAFPGLARRSVVEHNGVWPALNRSGSGEVSDSVVFMDAHSLPVDAVGYPPIGSGDKGRSLERVDLYRRAAPPVWVLSRDPLGASPGRRNERSILEPPPPSGLLEVTPNPFSPYEGQSVTISVNPPAWDVRVIVGVFDINGRRLADLGSAAAFPAVFLWYGTDANGRKVLPGLYIVACETFGDGGERTGVERVVVGCGRRDS